MLKINRRQFITFAVAGGGIVTASHFWLKQSKSEVNLSKQSSNPTQVYRSQNGLLEVDLEANYTEIDLGGRTAYLLTYNGQIPAPRLEAKVGDRIRIHFSNKLQQPTNLHYHGLHISPTGKADNVFLKINPRESFNYEFEITTNQPAGTFWYHPHLHSYAADQLSGGLAGLFVIRGELDEIPEIKAAKEEFLVLQDFALDDRGQLLSSDYLPIMAGREGNLITANGEINPTLTLAENGLLRLRILNASTSRFYNLAFENHPFYLIATDGGAIAQPIKMTQLLLTPGQRAEILLKGEEEPKTYPLLNLPYNRGGMGMMGGGMMGRRGGMMGRGIGDNNRNSNATNRLATLQYDSTVEPIPLPTQLTSISQLPEPDRKRTFTLNHGMAPGMGMVFLFNGQTYNHQRIDTQVKLNTVEEWELVNTGVMDHPFHVHVNSFQVISRNGQNEPYLAWRDTVLVRQGETVKIRILFQDFTGKTVYHCHILDHEDLGMMGNLEIIR
ncbi:multicopper oxidase family protein [Spirulina sp. 06S082]|uniref:multicopper oxidase family protein n=1 Tax=Spirulina sp. 06S082 TaxID=3110248 RepID=UPI002B20820F|nr:multicopper oxidase family protein [Spirulina sp. 06S082]MEA5472116.1 multicopper oxidase family protein [Spirulina sp. 06S082]